MILNTLKITAIKKGRKVELIASDCQLPMPDVLAWYIDPYNNQYIILIFYNTDKMRILHDLTEFKTLYEQSRSNYDHGLLNLN